MLPRRGRPLSACVCVCARARQEDNVMCVCVCVCVCVRERICVTYRLTTRENDDVIGVLFIGPTLLRCSPPVNDRLPMRLGPPGPD